MMARLRCYPDKPVFNLIRRELDMVGIIRDLREGV